MAWSVLQSASAAADANSVAATYTANVQAGTKLIACVAKNSGSANVTAVKDAAANSFTQLKAQGTATATILTLWAMDTPAGDVGIKPVITASGGTSTPGLGIVIMEVSGLLAGNTTAMCDGTAGGLTGTATSTGSPVYASTAASEFLLAAYGDLGESKTVVVAGGWTMTGVNTSSSADSLIQYKNSTGGTETDGFTAADAGGWNVIMVAFKLAAAAAQSPARLLTQRTPLLLPGAGRTGATYT